MHVIPRPHVARLALAHAALVLGLALACAACDTTSHVLGMDQPPTVTLTSGPVDTVSAPQSWLVDIAWTASDPDGRIDHFEYTIDPPTLKQARMAVAETTWVSTHEQHVVAHFRASHRDGPPGTTASEFHTFALRAVDDRGARSAIVARSFYATTIAPEVKLTRPIPNAFLMAQLPMPFRAEWEGFDPDGAGTTRPAFYRVLLKRLDDPSNRAYLSDPDSLWREGDQSGWAGWTTIPGDSTSMTVAYLPPGASGLMAVLAVDEAGATSPVLNLSVNFLQFTAAFPGSSAPLIHLSSTAVDFTYETGGYSTDPLREVPIEVGANVPLTFTWVGLAAPGRTVVSTRWMLDGVVTDDTPRSGPDDLAHWSAPAPPPGEANVPALGGGVHRLYLEVTDDFGEKSLAIVRISSVTATLQSDLLVVNDTRLEVDKFEIVLGRLQGPRPYTQPWPSATELDTFLFARGGVPWRNTQNPTTGVLSTAGLLAGYAYDTLGTRTGAEESSDAVPLSTLARYRHVLWLVDAKGAALDGYQYPSVFPSTALRSMSEPGKASQLSAYISMGGEVWLAGGGAAYASLVGFNRGVNDVGTTTEFTFGTGELGPGRVMYDAVHVRTALAVTKANTRFERSPAAIGGWSGHGPDGTLSAPDYSRLPGALHFHDPGVDPIPPTRLPSQGSLFYGTSTTPEYVFAGTSVVEDFGVPGAPRIESALDTLYNATGGVILTDPAPAMIYYHGRDNAPVVFTGFDLWSWTRSDCQALVDFVLGDIWKLSKSPTRAGARPASTMLHTSPPQHAATTRVSARLDPRRMRP